MKTEKSVGFYTLRRTATMWAIGLGDLLRCNDFLVMQI